MDMFSNDTACENLMRRNVDWVVFFFFILFNAKQASAHSKMAVAVKDFNFFTGTILQLELQRLKGLFEGYLFEVLLLGLFGCWLFIMHRMKPFTINQKIRDVAKSGVLGLPDEFTSPTLAKFCKGMKAYSGSYQSEKRPLTLPLLIFSLAMI